jgi:glycerophosphoryl diester phosphodiesterase
VEQVHELGIRVCAYTVDAIDRMSELQHMGVDAIISNDIRALVRTVGDAAHRGGRTLPERLP